MGSRAPNGRSTAATRSTYGTPATDSGPVHRPRRSRGIGHPADLPHRPRAGRGRPAGRRARPPLRGLGASSWRRCRADELNDATSVGQVDRAMHQVSWNENVIAADDHGSMGYWRPGLRPLRPRRSDERLPYPGDGRAEWRGLVPRERTPHMIDPSGLARELEQPAVGRLDERRFGGARAARRAAAPGPDPACARPRGGPRPAAGDRRRSPDLGDDGAAVPVRRPAPAGAGGEAADGASQGTLGVLLDWDGDYAAADEAGTVDPRFRPRKSSRIAARRCCSRR